MTVVVPKDVVVPHSKNPTTEVVPVLALAFWIAEVDVIPEASLAVILRVPGVSDAVVVKLRTSPRTLGVPPP